MHNPAPKTIAPQWRELRGEGKPKASLFNAKVGIMAMKISCRHDLFRDVTVIGYAGDDTVHEVKPLIGELTNAALTRLRDMFSHRFGFDPEEKHIHDAVKTLAFSHCYDPILDLLDEAQAAWDGTKRLDTWVVDYLGCGATELNCTIGRKVLIAAARRAREHGCKFDTITVLEGPEGKDKSTAIRVLAGDAYFSDQRILGARDREVQEQLCGVWMHESADLTGLKKAEVAQVKAFASRQWDRARPAYGRVLERKPRRGILWATTNDEEYLQSETGNRRFWPLTVGAIDIAALRRDRLELLGEAAHYESEGESIVLDKALWGDAAVEQERRRAKHPWEDILANIPVEVDVRTEFTSGFVSSVQIVYRTDDGKGDDGKEFVREEVSSADLLTHVLRVQPAQQARHHSMTLSATMKLLGWKRPDSLKISINGKQVPGYFRRVPK